MLKQGARAHGFVTDRWTQRRIQQVMEAHGLRCPQSAIVSTVEEALALVGLGPAGAAPITLSFPVLIRPSFTLGGSGGGAYNEAELREKCVRGLRESPVGQVLIEQSVLGWKEFELDRKSGYGSITTGLNNYFLIPLSTTNNFSSL